MIDWQRGLRWMLSLAGFALPLLLLCTGCSTFAFLRPREKPLEEKIDPIATPHRADSAALPGKYSFRVAPYVFLSDFEIRKDQPLFVELAQLRDAVYKELLLPAGTAVVQVYLFENKETYTAYMNLRHKDLPPRRAFFIAQPRGLSGEDLIVYTYWSDRIRQDLRHELTHALLHSVIHEVPLWLDEGLAEYFELPPEKKCINAEHVDLLRRGIANGSYKPNLARLEGLKQVDDMNPAEYREAWAWVHLLLHSDAEAKTALLSYLQQLRGTRTPGALAEKVGGVFADPNKTFADHLGTLETRLTREPVDAERATARK